MSQKEEPTKECPCECGHQCHCHHHGEENECECGHHCHCHHHGEENECESCQCCDEEECFCDCCCGAPPTLLAPRLKVKGASKPEIFTEGKIVDEESEASKGFHVQITLPANSFVSQANILVLGEGTQFRIIYKNGGEEVFRKDYTLTEEISDFMVEYQGIIEEIEIINLLDELAQPLKIGGFLIAGAPTDVCSIFQTGQAPYFQPLYFCKTCNFQEGQCICKACADHCHKGHELELLSSTGYCDCPEICKCQLMIPDDVTCTYAENGPEMIEQKLFICKICGYGPKQRCCEACAKYCHSGHLIEQAPETYGRCACGGQNAPGPVCKFVPPVDDCVNCCTYTKYGDKPVMQEMFRCETCNSGEDQLMCMACALVCHVTHKLVKVGQKEGVCACGKHLIKDSACHLTNDTRPRPAPLVGCPCCMGAHH